MSDVKELIDQYAAENQALRAQAEQFLLLVRALAVLHQDSKGKVRIPTKLQIEADKYTLDINQLKTSIVLTVKEKDDT